MNKYTLPCVAKSAAITLEIVLLAVTLAIFIQGVHAYSLDLKIMDWDLTDAISNAYVTMTNSTDNVQVSDGNGWANYTGINGTVSIKVQYYGFWVNGTFNVTVSSDTVIYVQCKLYDVTVKIVETQHSAYLVDANVTVFNSTSDEANKITSGITNSNGIVQLNNLPNNTLTFTQYGGPSYTIVIGNATQLVSSEDQTFTNTADQNFLSTSSNYLIIAFFGITVSLERNLKNRCTRNKSEKKK